MVKKHKLSIFSVILLIFSMLTIFFPTQTAQALENGTAQIIATKCNLYEEASFSSDKVIINDTDQQPVIITLHFGDHVQVEQIDSDFALVTTEKSVKGWVYQYYLSQTPSQEIYPVFNGTIIKETLIYDIDGLSTGFLAKEGQRVFLFEGFDSKKDSTAIQIALEDGSLLTGYVSTTCVEPDGVSKTLIAAITISVAAITIVLSLIFIRKKIKNKKNNKKEKKS